MKTLSLLIISIICFSIAQAQPETNAAKKMIAAFTTHYNASNTDSIFALFNGDMKTALPLDKTEQTISQLQQQLGKIETTSFVGYDKTYAQYKTKFTNTEFQINISLDNSGKLNGLFFKPYAGAEASKALIERNATAMTLPFTDKWKVTWGGDTKEQNYHVESQAQKNAFDFVVVNEKDQSFKTDGKTNEDYYAFGKKILAVSDAEVVQAVDGVKDNIPGAMNPAFLLGNSVILKTAKGEYLFYAHFKQGSVAVKQGDKVKKGQLLGLCGNSGNSTEPHLHFHVQDREDLGAGFGVKVYFENVMLKGEMQSAYSPVKNDVVSGQ